MFTFSINSPTGFTFSAGLQVLSCPLFLPATFFIRLYRRGRRGYLHQQSTEQEPERNPDVQRAATHGGEKTSDLRGRPWISAPGPSLPAPLQSNSRTSFAGRGLGAQSRVTDSPPLPHSPARDPTPDHERDAFRYGPHPPRPHLPDPPPPWPLVTPPSPPPDTRRDPKRLRSTSLCARPPAPPSPAGPAPRGARWDSSLIPAPQRPLRAGGDSVVRGSRKGTAGRSGCGTVGGRSSCSAGGLQTTRTETQTR